jgi:hypothetical protein
MYMRFENGWGVERLPLMMPLHGTTRPLFVDPYASGLRFKDGEPGVLEQLRQMAETLSEQYGLDDVMVAGGRFFAHPWRSGISLHQEWMLWYDRRTGQELLEQVMTERTNYAMITVSKMGQDVSAFLDRIGFPTHAVVIRPSAGTSDAPFFHGLQSLNAVEEAIACSAEAAMDGRILLQSDMRAHVNPTRMNVLRQLADKLSDRLRTIQPDDEKIPSSTK